jgi:plastocyanin
MTKKLSFLLAAAAAAVSAAALAGPAATATTRSVKIGDNFYVKDDAKITVTVKRNDKVRWNWTGGSPHDVTVGSGPVKFHSKVQERGSYTKKMTRRGTYKIFCSIHGASDQSMTLKVK